VFWGAIRAGVVPIPVNTLLPPEQVSYILSDSRAEALVVSAPLLPALRPVLDGLPGLHVIVASLDGRPVAALPTGAADLSHLLATATPSAEAVEAGDDEVAFWLYSSGSTGAPKGVKHVHSSARSTCETYAWQVLGIGAEDTVYSAAKLFFAYGLGNAMTFPMSVGAHAVLLPDRPTPDAVMAVMAWHRPTIFCGVPTLFAAMLANPALSRGATSATAPRAARCPATTCASWTRTVRTYRMARRANCWCAGRPPPRATGTSGPRAAAPSPANGR
jgi:acyl-coenzyme A synthetase/AMP-(fatty) acid ligase